MKRKLKHYHVNMTLLLALLLATYALPLHATPVNEWVRATIADFRSDSTCPRFEYKEITLLTGEIGNLGILLSGSMSELTMTLPLGGRHGCDSPSQFIYSWIIGGALKGSTLEIVATFGECTMGSCSGEIKEQRKFIIHNYDVTSERVILSEPGSSSEALPFITRERHADEMNEALDAFDELTGLLNAQEFSKLFSRYDMRSRGQSENEFTHTWQLILQRLGGGVYSRVIRISPLYSEANRPMLIVLSGIVGKNGVGVAEFASLTKIDERWKILEWWILTE